jgi:hypothetical protein
MNLLDYALIALAAWTSASMLVYEDCPFKLCARLRAITTLGGLLECVRCASVWTGLVCLLLYPAAPILVQVLAVSGAAIAIDKWNNS